MPTARCAPRRPPAARGCTSPAGATEQSMHARCGMHRARKGGLLTRRCPPGRARLSILRHAARMERACHLPLPPWARAGFSTVQTARRPLPCAPRRQIPRRRLPPPRHLIDRRASRLNAPSRRHLISSPLRARVTRSPGRRATVHVPGPWSRPAALRARGGGGAETAVVGSWLPGSGRAGARLPRRADVCSDSTALRPWRPPGARACRCSRAHCARLSGGRRAQPSSSSTPTGWSQSCQLVVAPCLPKQSQGTSQAALGGAPTQCSTPSVRGGRPALCAVDTAAARRTSRTGRLGRAWQVQGTRAGRCGGTHWCPCPATHASTPGRGKPEAAGKPSCSADAGNEQHRRSSNVKCPENTAGPPRTWSRHEQEKSAWPRRSPAPTAGRRVSVAAVRRDTRPEPGPDHWDDPPSVYPTPLLPGGPALPCFPF